MKKISILALLLLGLATTFWLGSAWEKNKEIDRSMVHTAAELIGLEFTQAEVDTMLPDLENLREDYQKNWELPMHNGIAPALVFNPLPQGFQVEMEQKPIVFSPSGNTKMPANKADLAWYTIHQLADLIRTRQITSVELTQFFLDRLRKYDPTLHFVISYTEDRAFAAARRADAEIAAGNYRGPLHGIPYGAKDLLAVPNYKTTWGAAPYKDQMLNETATVIQKLDEAGAVLIAKLTLGALAWGDVWYGERTRNPWNPEQGSSGSSAGSASAVSAGCVPFALGTETLGSIVSPSTVCGTTGLRPTFGRVSKSGAMALSWSMDKIGPITRSVEDAAIVFDAIRGADGLDHSVREAAFNYDARQDINKLRVGYFKKAFEGQYGFKEQDAQVLKDFEAMGIELIPIELPPLPDIRFILNAEAAAAFDELTRSNRDDELVRQIRFAWPNTFRRSRFIPAVEYINANRLRSQLIEEMDDLFDDIDLYIHPSWGNSSLTMTNLTGHPSVVMPSGFREGTPTSISLTGKLFGEAELLAFAKYWQDRTEWDERHPEL